MDPTISNSRRGFFTGALLHREGRTQLKESIKPIGPSPPGLSQIADAHICSSCDAYCVQACDQSVIKRHPDNHDLHGIPYLDFSENGCTFCSQCSTHCPEVEEIELESNHDLGKVVISSSCYLKNSIICMSCIKSCPKSLIHLNHYRQLDINIKNCDGCGSCVSSCPAQALSVST